MLTCRSLMSRSLAYSKAGTSQAPPGNRENANMISNYMSERFENGSQLVAGADSSMFVQNNRLEFDDKSSELERSGVSNQDLYKLSRLVPAKDKKEFVQRVTEALRDNDLHQALLQPMENKRTESFNSKLIFKLSPKSDETLVQSRNVPLSQLITKRDLKEESSKKKQN